MSHLLMAGLGECPASAGGKPLCGLLLRLASTLKV